MARNVALMALLGLSHGHSSRTRHGSFGMREAGSGERCRRSTTLMTDQEGVMAKPDKAGRTDMQACFSVWLTNASSNVQELVYQYHACGCDRKDRA